MQNFNYEGNLLYYTNGTGTAIASGQAVIIQNELTVAVDAIPIGTLGTVLRRGVVTLAADATTAFNQEAPLFINSTTLVLYATPGTGRIYAGLAAEAKVSSAATARVNLNQAAAEAANVAALVPAASPLVVVNEP